MAIGLYLYNLFPKQDDGYSMTLSGLVPDAVYEIRVRAMNSHGWSPLSDSFQFKTSRKGNRCSAGDYLLSQYSSSRNWLMGPESVSRTCL